jgi:hypothetical protein
MTIRKLLIQTALGAVIGAGALAAFSAPASAYVVCNREGDCWHTRDRYNYNPSFGLTIHDDNWRWGDRDRYRWREHDGRGYWRNGAWIRF